MGLAEDVVREATAFAGGKQYFSAETPLRDHAVTRYRSLQSGAVVGETKPIGSDAIRATLEGSDGVESFLLLNGIERAARRLHRSLEVWPISPAGRKILEGSSTPYRQDPQMFGDTGGIVVYRLEKPRSARYLLE